MKVITKSPYEPLDIEIGNTVISCMINLTPNNLIKLSEECNKVREEVNRAADRARKAEANRDTKALKKANDSLAECMESPIKTAIGDEGYKHIYEACKATKPSDCNMVFLQVFMAIANEVATRNTTLESNSKMAHYLQGVDDAPTIAYPGI